jgi:hypothetical protein
MKCDSFLCNVESRFNERVGLWLLKNSLSEIVLKKQRARMSYKRFSPAGYTFLVTHLEVAFQKIDLFNSHLCYLQLRV